MFPLKLLDVLIIPVPCIKIHIDKLDDGIVHACLTAGEETIPKSGSKRSGLPGWNAFVKKLQKQTINCHNSHNSPHNGDVFQMRQVW